MSLPAIWYLPTPNHTRTVFAPPAYQRLLDNFALTANPGPSGLSAQQVEEGIGDFEGLVTGWGTPPLSPKALERAGRLRVIAHSAGSVKHLFTPEQVENQLLRRGICVASANGAIALNVAEHTVGALIAMSRQWFTHSRNIREKGIWHDPPIPRSSQHLRGAVLGLIGASTVGREVIHLLQPFDVTILVYDPFLSDWEAGRLGVEKVELDEAFRRADLVTVHAPKIPQTYHLIGAPQLKLLRDGAVFVNTSRGSVLDHEALLAEARTGRIQVQLDVTDPEPLPPDHPLRALENVVITPHTSGAGQYGYHRIGEYALLALEAFFQRRPVPGQVDLKRWAQLA
ncbi:MAG: hydroxyacid dehydrogenase [Candidatus Handelsmanbacteria bacterium]|nr:hydroxyacid dehydrogenase [Candidatus Handelsmanbacteria bacterium]